MFDFLQKKYFIDVSDMNNPKLMGYDYKDDNGFYFFSGVFGVLFFVIMFGYYTGSNINMFVGCLSSLVCSMVFLFICKGIYKYSDKRQLNFINNNRDYYGNFYKINAPEHMKEEDWNAFIAGLLLNNNVNKNGNVWLNNLDNKTVNRFLKNEEKNKCQKEIEASKKNKINQKIEDSKTVQSYSTEIDSFINKSLEQYKTNVQ